MLLSRWKTSVSLRCAHSPGLFPPIQSHPHRSIFRQHQLRDAVSERADIFERNVGEAFFNYADLFADLLQGFDHVAVVVQVVAVVALAELGRKVGSPGRKEHGQHIGKSA